MAAAPAPYGGKLGALLLLGASKHHFGLLRATELLVALPQTFEQAHPVFSLVRRDVLPHLAAFLDRGGRKIDAWYATLRVAEVPFDDEADAFRNINTAAELAANATQAADGTRTHAA